MPKILDLILEMQALDFRNTGEEYRDGGKQPLVGVTQVWVLKMALKGGVF